MDGSAAAWDERYAASDLVWGLEPNRWVVEQVADLRPGRALDLATGEGRNAIWLASCGWQVVGVDFSRVALDRARRLVAERSPDLACRLDWQRADVREYVPQPGGFDLVLVIYLHVRSTERPDVLRRAAAAVAPGGHLLVVGHDSTNLTEGVGGPQYPEVLFTAEDVLADLAGCGLVVLRAERVRRPVGDRQALDALAFLRRPS